MWIFLSEHPWWGLVYLLVVLLFVPVGVAVMFNSWPRRQVCCCEKRDRKVTWTDIAMAVVGASSAIQEASQSVAAARDLTVPEAPKVPDPPTGGVH